MSITTNEPSGTNMQAMDAAFRSIIRTFGLLRRVTEPYFGRFGISGSQWGVLRALHRAEAEGVTSLRVTDLSNRLLVQPPSTTGVVDRLQRMGLVQRKASPNDQRARQVSLTPAGRNLLERVLLEHPTQIAAVMGALNVEEQQELHRLMDKLGAHLKEMAERVEQPDPT